MSPLNFLNKCIWILVVLHLTLSNPIQRNDDEYYIEAHLNNLLKRFEMLSKRVDAKYSDDLKTLMEKFNVVFDSHNFENEVHVLGSYIAELNPDFAEYLQYELDVQSLNQEIKFLKWYAEQLILQTEDPQLIESMKLMLPLYDEALKTEEFDEKFEDLANIDSETPQHIIDLMEGEPVDIPITNVILIYIRELLLYCLQDSTARDFESDIKSFLEDVEQALSSTATYEKKKEIIDRFEQEETNFERFLDAKGLEFQLHKFGVE